MDNKVLEPTDGEYSFLSAISTVVLIFIVGSFIKHEPKVSDLVDTFIVTFLGTRYIYVVIKLNRWREYKRLLHNDEQLSSSKTEIA